MVSRVQHHFQDECCSRFLKGGKASHLQCYLVTSIDLRNEGHFWWHNCVPRHKSTEIHFFRDWNPRVSVVPWQDDCSPAWILLPEPCPAVTSPRECSNWTCAKPASSQTILLKYAKSLQKALIYGEFNAICLTSLASILFNFSEKLNSMVQLHLLH